MELFERPQQGDLAVLVQIKFSSRLKQNSLGSDATYDKHEFIELVHSAGASDVAFVTGSRQRPDSRLFVGQGKAEEIHQLTRLHNADVVIFDHSLSPAQERNLEEVLQCRVLDRTGLILDIFAQRARSHEGKLQVELAQLKHMSTRLIRGWTHLERQKGGIGLRGPGETQLETDRRLLNVRIKQINRRLEKVQNQREQGRQSRKRAEIPSVSLVGYTNAGKSTLFNQITNSNVYVADQLFATLDPTLRRLDLPNQQAVILADTVGFIRDLPHDLVAAFRSTLQETIEADLLLHVIDVSDDQRDLYRQQVHLVLREIGADKIPQIEVMNKIDLIDQVAHYVDAEAEEKLVGRAYVSAQEDQGLDLLKEQLSHYFADQLFEGVLCLKPQMGKLRATLYQEEAIQKETISEKGEFLLSLRMQKKHLQRVLNAEGVALDSLLAVTP